MTNGASTFCGHQHHFGETLLPSQIHAVIRPAHRVSQSILSSPLQEERIFFALSEYAARVDAS